MITTEDIEGIIDQGKKKFDILSGEERARANRHPPEDKKEYMLRYVEALKNRPRRPSRWMKKEAEREAWVRERLG